MCSILQQTLSDKCIFCGKNVWQCTGPHECKMSIMELIYWGEFVSYEG